MDKLRVYLETSVVSFLAARASCDAIQVIRKSATEQWWREYRPQCDAFVSELVDREIERGDAVAARRRQEAVALLARVQITNEARALTRRLLLAHALPDIAEGDAMHVALATIHKMDILLTWNCKHLANVIMMPKIRATVEEANYNLPLITTPANLLESMGELL